jgi:SNF2 family DNA or RNA helicase
MGLGKTVQVVTTIEHLYSVEELEGPFLVVVPLSTIDHWAREFEGWSEQSVCLYYDPSGGAEARAIIRDYEWYYPGRSKRMLKFHTLITTYENLMSDFEELSHISWRVVVVDEAHRLRTAGNKLTDCMNQILLKGEIEYGFQLRLLMTGTPLQNNTQELWSLLNFIEPRKFPDMEKFEEKYGNMKSPEQVRSLQRRLEPHLLRRIKEDVATDIPAKEEIIVDVELTSLQKQYYRAIFDRNREFLHKLTNGKKAPQLQNIQMELRKCCNHPFLVEGVELVRDTHKSPSISFSYVSLSLMCIILEMFQLVVHTLNNKNNNILSPYELIIIGGDE